MDVPRNGNIRPIRAEIQIYIIIRAAYAPSAIKCAFHPDGDEDEEDEQEGELGGDDVPVCYSPPAGKLIPRALTKDKFSATLTV